jgi:2-dehydropantoate 2-reductase
MDAIYVVGAGGIGCAVGYALCAAGACVTFVEADPAKVVDGAAHGVGVDRRPRLPARWERFTDWTPDPGATVLLCTKCYDNPEVLARLPDSVALVPIQNGFDPALEKRRHAVEGIASFVSECAPGRAHTRITRAGRLHLGFRHPTADRPGPDLTRLLARNRMFRVTWVPDVLPYKYTKLMYNAAISPVASAAGLDNGQILSLPRARRLFFDLLQENHTILREAQVPLGKIGPLHPATVARILDRRRLANALAWAFYPTLRGSYCSMSGDLPRGRTEIDYYNGRLIALANGRPCPLNRRVYALVKRMEAGHIEPCPEVLAELA